MYGSSELTITQLTFVLLLLHLHTQIIAIVEGNTGRQITIHLHIYNIFSMSLVCGRKLEYQESSNMTQTIGLCGEGEVKDICP